MILFFRLYWPILLALIVTGAIAFNESLLILPASIVLNTETTNLSPWALSLFYFSVAWFLTRLTRIFIIGQFFSQQMGMAIPKLVGDLLGLFYFSLALLFVLTYLFYKDITTLLATGGIGLAILGFAMQDTLYSLISGIMLNMERALKIGDRVRFYQDQINKPHEGKILEINWRATHLLAENNVIVIVPNSYLVKVPVINLTANNNIGKKEIDLYIDYQTSVDSAERILMASALATPGILSEPPPEIRLEALVQDSIHYKITFYATQIEDYGNALAHALMKQVLERLHAAGISPSYPKLELFIARKHQQIADHHLDRFYFISQIELFKDLPEAYRRELAKMMAEFSYQAGQLISYGDKEIDRLLMVAEGLVTCEFFDFKKEKLSKRRLVSTEIIGEFSVLTGEPLLIKAQAETNVLLYSLQTADFAEFIKIYPDAIDLLSKKLALSEEKHKGLHRIEGLMRSRFFMAG